MISNKVRRNHLKKLKCKLKLIGLMILCFCSVNLLLISSFAFAEDIVLSPPYTDVAVYPDAAYHFDFNDGFQGTWTEGDPVFAWAVRDMGPVTGTRDLPDYASAGSDMDYSIEVAVDEANLPSAIILNEYIPYGWILRSCTPNQNSYNWVTGEIKWLFGLFAPVADITISCSVYVPASVPKGAVRGFSGDLNFFSGGSVTVDIDGDQDVQIGEYCLYSSYDTNQDWEVGDFELLDAIDTWVAGSLGDFELLDLIDYWAFGSYCCDEANEHQQGVPDEGGICEQ